MEQSASVSQAPKISKKTFSVREFLFRIFQVRKNKPRSVKIVQWVAVPVIVLILLLAWGFGAFYEALYFLFLPIFLPIILMFCFLYLYRYWSLIGLRILSIYFLLMFPAILALLIWSLYGIIPSYLGVDYWHDINLNNSLFQYVSEQEFYEFVKNFAIWSFVAISGITIFFAVLFHFLWNQLSEYRRRNTQPTS